MTDIASFLAEHGQSMASSLRALSDVPHPETVFNSSPLFNDVVISAPTKASFQTHNATSAQEKSPSYHDYRGLPKYVLEDSDNDSDAAIVRHDESETHLHQHSPTRARHHSSNIVALPPKALHLRRSEEKEERACTSLGVAVGGGKEGGEAEMSSFDTFAAQSVTSTTEQSATNPTTTGMNSTTNSTKLLKSNSSNSIKSSSMSSASSPSPAEKEKEKDKNKMILAERFKTQFCRSYERGEVCPYGYNCMFAHGPAELRTVEANLNDKLCTQEAIDAFRRGQRAVEQSTRATSGAISLSTPPLPAFSAPPHNPLSLIVSPATSNSTPHSSMAVHPAHQLYSSMNAMSLSAPITAANTHAAPTAPSASSAQQQQQPHVAMSPPPLPMQMIAGYSTYPAAFYHHPFAAPSYQHHQPNVPPNGAPAVALLSSPPYQPYPYPPHPFAYTITHGAGPQPSPSALYGQQYAPHAYVPTPSGSPAASGGPSSCAFYDSNGQRLSDETSQKVMRFLQQEAEKERSAAVQQQITQQQIYAAPHATTTTAPPTCLPMPLTHHQYSPATPSGMALHHHAVHQPHFGFSMVPTMTMATVPTQGSR